MPMAMAETLYPKLPYNLARDTAPIVQVSFGYNILVAHPSVPATSVAALVAHLKSNPGKLNYASGGIGAPAHISAELFRQVTQTDMVHVPVKSAPFAVQDLLAGRVEVMFGLAPGVLPHVRAGKLRALAVVGRERLAALPDVPSMAELGYPNVEARDWMGLIAPVRPPAAIIDRLNREVNAILCDPDVRERFAAGSTTIAGGTSEAFARLIAEDVGRWAGVIRAASIRLVYTVMAKNSRGDIG